MLPISRGAFANIYRYIEYSAFYAADQLALGIWWMLEMQATHHAIAAHRLVVLAEVNTVSQDMRDLLFKLSLRKRLKEITTCIVEDARLYHYKSFDICLNYLHNQSILERP